MRIRMNAMRSCGIEDLDREITDVDTKWQIGFCDVCVESDQCRKQFHNDRGRATRALERVLGGLLPTDSVADKSILISIKKFPGPL